MVRSRGATAFIWRRATRAGTPTCAAHHRTTPAWRRRPPTWAAALVAAPAAGLSSFQNYIAVRVRPARAHAFALQHCLPTRFSMLILKASIPPRRGHAGNFFPRFLLASIDWTQIAQPDAVYQMSLRLDAAIGSLRISKKCSLYETILTRKILRAPPPPVKCLCQKN